MPNPAVQPHQPLRQRQAALVGLLRRWLDIDDWSDELIASAQLVRETREVLGETTAAQPAPAQTARFTLTDYATAIDHTTGLEWQLLHSDTPRTHAEAQGYCEECEVGGFPDWRMPTLAELETLIDRSVFNPATHAELRHCTRPGFYWSSTPDVSDPEGCAWGVYFYDGNAGIHCRVYGGFVRAVRSLPSASPGQ